MKLFSKMLNATSVLAVSAIFLGSALTSCTWAMHNEVDEKAHVIPPKLMAPFSAKNVIEHAATYPIIYDMEYLTSETGKQHTQQVINSINKDEWPQNDYVEGAWNKGQPDADYNKSLIGRYVSQEYMRSLHGLTSDEKIVKQMQLWERLEDGTLKITYNNHYESNSEIYSLRKKLRCGEGAFNRESPELRFKLIPNNFYGACSDYALTEILGTSLEVNPEMPSRYKSPVGSSRSKYEGITPCHIMPCLQTIFTQVQEPGEGDLAVYYSEQEDVAYDEHGVPYNKLMDKEYHYGIYCADGNIVSKWGYGPTYKHLPFYVPSSYGEKIKFYRLICDGPITHELLSDLSAAYVGSFSQHRIF